MRDRCFVVVAALVTGLLVAVGDTTRADDPSTFTGVGFLTGGNVSEASDISADGTIVVGTAEEEGGDQAFRWTAAGGMEALGGLTPGDPSQGRGISPNGVYIVGRAPDGLTGYAEPFVWTNADGMSSMGNLLTGFEGRGNAATDAGLCVGSIWPSVGDAEGFHWTSGGGQVLLPWLAATPTSYASDVSNVGDVIVGWSVGTLGTEAVRWVGFTPTGLGDLPGGVFNSSARGCSSDGAVVVGVATDASGSAAFRWTSGGGMVSLEAPGEAGPSSLANACSADGSVVVGRISGVAMIWTQADGIQRLQDLLVARGVSNLTGWSLESATGVSADGKTICGYGVDPDEESQAWVAYLGAASGGGGNVPPPGTIRSFLLPKKAKLVVGPLPGKRAPKPGLKLSAFFDTGPDPVDLSRPAVVTIGTKEIAVTGLQAFKNFKWRYTTGELDIKVKTSSYGSSKGRFVMKYTGDLAGDATPDGVLDVIYTTDQFSARGAVVLENGKFTFGRRPGTLIAPEFSVRKAKAKLSGVGADFKVVAGFTSDGNPPPAAPPCNVAFGDIHNVRISADSFKRVKPGYVLQEKVPGISACLLNFAKERVALRGAKIDLGDVPEGGSPLLLIVTVGDDERAVLVRAARKGKILKY